MENKIKSFQKSNSAQPTKKEESESSYDTLFKLQSLLKEEIVIKERCTYSLHYINS